MSFLTSLLNPEPTGGSQASDEALKTSLPAVQPDGQMPQAYPQTQLQSPPSIPQDGHQPQPYPDAQIQPVHQRMPNTTAHDAAQALAVLYGSDVAAPSAWGNYRNSTSQSPKDTRSDMRRLSSSTRRSSIYGDNTAPIELPQPPPVARKMSSPSLEQYHVVSRRSPEQARRPSYVLGNADRALTLAPIHSPKDAQSQAPVGLGLEKETDTATSKDMEEDKLEGQTRTSQSSASIDGEGRPAIGHGGEEQTSLDHGKGEKAALGQDGKRQPALGQIEEEQTSVGQDNSVVIAQNEPEQTPVVDAAEEMQRLADSREPAYTRQEPTTTQIRQPSVSEAEAASDAPAVPSLLQPDVPETTDDNASSPRAMEIDSTSLDKTTNADIEPGPDAPSSDNTAETDNQPEVASIDNPSKSDDDSTRAPLNAQPPFAALKQEHSAQTNSPLREFSVPVPSTESTDMPLVKNTVPRKRPPPKSAKKGTASSVKREPPAKKRKTDSTAATSKRSGTPSSQRSRPGLASAKRLASTSATPANSSPAPRSVRNGSSPPRSVASVDQDGDGEAQYSNDEEEEDQGTPDPDADLYCLCKRPDTGTFMIGCDGGCDDWFHGKCVGIAERDKGLIDRYVCPRCVENGIGHTTWKRMCRRRGCRMPARTPRAVSTKKGKKEESASKYCSNACGVQFFKDLVARTRGSTDSSSQRSKTKKNLANLGDMDDLGPRGGALSAGELKAMVNIATGVDDFKRFGEGILSPPATPTNKSRRPSTLTNAEQERLADITSKKDATRTRHALLKDRLKFIALMKQTATTLAESRGLKPKEFCGFDQRMTWTEEEFDVWRTSHEGLTALKSGAISAAPATDADGDTGMTNGDRAEGEEEAPGPNAIEVCDKKRCARHHDWAKLALDDTRFEMSENSEVMRGLDKDEKDLLQRAGLRARVLRAGGAGGTVVVHDEDDNNDAGSGGEDGEEQSPQSGIEPGTQSAQANGQQEKDIVPNDTATATPIPVEEGALQASPDQSKEHDSDEQVAKTIPDVTSSVDPAGPAIPEVQ